MTGETPPLDFEAAPLPEQVRAPADSPAGKRPLFETEGEGAGGGGEYRLELVSQPAPVPAVAAPAVRHYKRPYREYVAIYGKAERTILWWVRQGRERETPDLPPLDDPAKMPEWWARVMRQRCPDVVLSAARVAPVAPQVAPSMTSAPGGVPSSKVSPPASVATTAGFEDNLRNLREQVSKAYAALVDAQNAPDPDPVKIEIAQRHWMKLDAAAQAAEAKAPDILEKMGRLVDREQLAAELAPMLGAVANSIRSMRRRLKPQLAKATSEAEEDAIWQRGIDEAFEDLKNAGYAPVFELAA